MTLREWIWFGIRLAWAARLWRESDGTAYTLTPRAWRELHERDQRRWN